MILMRDVDSLAQEAAGQSERLRATEAELSGR